MSQNAPEQGREDVMRLPLPPMPKIGLDRHVYATRAKEAESHEDHHDHEAQKVGLYITLAIDPHATWKEKLKYFRHALEHHCKPPPFPEEDVWNFYAALKVMVKEQAGREAIRLGSAQDDFYAARTSMGQTRDEIADEAEEFFMELLRCGSTFQPAEGCPDHFCEEDWMTLKMIRDQWI